MILKQQRSRPVRRRTELKQRKDLLMDATPEAAKDDSSRESRPVVLVSFEPRSYREAIGSVVRDLKPRLEVRIVDPDELGAEVARLDPELVLCSQPNTFTTNDKPTWFEFRPYDKPTAQICVSGQRSELEEVELDDLLSLVDRETVPSMREDARRPDRPPPIDSRTGASVHPKTTTT